MARTYIGEAICPACGHHGLEYRAEQVDLPYLGNSLETMLRCTACGYRHTDFMLTDQREPTRFSYTVAAEEDMAVRVVRASSGTVRIPELGILIEPGMASEAFISNVEGVLVRIERVLHQLRNDAQGADGQEMLERIMELEETMQNMRKGTAPPVTLILDDPLGNSAIVHEGALRQRIPDEEAAKLKVGAFVIDPGVEGEEE